MRVIRCPNCNKPLPAWAQYCGACGKSLAPPTQESLSTKGSEALKSQDANNSSNRPRAEAVECRFIEHVSPSPPLSTPAPTTPAPTVPHFFIIEADEIAVGARFIAPEGGEESVGGEQTGISAAQQEDISIQHIMEGLWEPPTPNGASTNGKHNGVLTEEGDELEETIEDAWHSRINWHKDLPGAKELKRAPQASLRAPTPTLPDNRIEGETPPGLMIPPSLPARRRMPSGMVFWVSMLLLFGLVIGGLFGVVVTLGHGAFMPPPPHHAGPSLQVNPSSVALGALISLQGSNFTPKGRIGLSYDANIPVIDTDGNSVILADKAGNFTDTAIVEPEWQAGPHTIYAEDATLHKIASFTVMVTGQSPSLRPAHLRLSTDAIDLGSGDQATNSTQTVRLMNIGGGLVTWQAAVTRPWLMVSPQNGTFANNQSVQIVIAANRSNLAPGSYTASVIFSSNAGQIDLPVKMEVTLLQPGHVAILQLTPAVLSFNATDGGTNPSGQIATISNPGTQSLQWSARSVSTSPIYRGSGPDWLSISPRSGSVAQGASEAVTIGANINDLLPGVYNGLVTFTSQESGVVKGSPQSVYVSLTVLPQCVLHVSPGALSFAGAHLQAPTINRGATVAKVVDLSVTQGCSAPLHWSATTTTDDGRQWLNIDGADSANGTTPANPSVSVNVTGLAAGTYTGAVLFSSTVGTQTLPVTLTIGQSTTPIMLTTPTAMAFNAMVGQSSPDKQTITITNTGGGTFTWNAMAATDVGGSWLAVTPATGILSAQQSTSVTVSATLLSSLTPDLYNGTITIIGFGSAGNPASGSPQQIPVTFRVQAACAIVVAPTALSFTGVAGQSDAETQAVTISTNGACGHSLGWTATVATSDGGSWLTTTPTTGQVNVSTAHVGVVLTGLSARTYTGRVSISATDRVAHQPVGTPQTIEITLTVQPPCTLHPPSSTQETFNVEAGSNPAPQTFSVGVIGNCVADVTITPTVTLASGAGWLTVTPATATVHEGSATFEVRVTSAALSAASYTGSISLSAVAQGITINGSPQKVDVTLNMLIPPTVSVSPGSLMFNVTGGVTTQSFTISNTGGAPLKWRATLAPDAPRFVKLSASPDTNLDAGAHVDVQVIVDATGVPGGTRYTTSVMVRAIDPATGNEVPGSPARVSIMINVASAALPSMQVSSTHLLLHAMTGKGSLPRSLTVTNTGGGTLTWTVNVPADAGWLQVSPMSDSDAPGASSTLTFTADAIGLQPGVYLARVTITPSGGAPIEVAVTLRVSAPLPTPRPPPATPTATPTDTPTPTPTATPTDTPTPTPTATPTDIPTATP